MLLFDLLQLEDPDLRPEKTKLHLASWNGQDDPLDVFFEGKFNEWQSWQTRRNFERRFVVSLIALPKPDRWLYAGSYDVLGRESLGEQGHMYDLRPRQRSPELDGRLVVSFRRTGRQSYLVGERWAQNLEVAELLPVRMTVGDFPGYPHVRLPMRRLRTIVNQELSSWKSALSSVAGVYVIADTRTGKLYIGSATGEGGLWARWCAYAESSHGGNKELMALLRERGAAHAEGFQFAVLEIADTHASGDDVLARESHWKQVLLTRSHGFNAN